MKNKRNWREMRNKLKTQLGEIKNESIDSIKENFSLIPAAFQNAYVNTKEYSRKSLNNIKRSIHKATKPSAIVPVELINKSNQKEKYISRDRMF